MKDKASDVYVAEFESLRDEIFSRFEFQRQAFNYLMALFAALIAAAADGKFQKIDLRWLLIVPLISCPLSYIFFDNEIVIWSIGSYINNELRLKVSISVGDDVLMLEQQRGVYLLRSTKVLHIFLSLGRWILFLMPAVVPLIFSLKNGWVQSSTLFAVIFAVDTMLSLVLMWAVVLTLKMRLTGWRSG